MKSTSEFIPTVRQFIDIVTHHSMRERAHFAKETGLSMPQFGILMQLHHRGTSGMSEIGERFGVTPAAASQLVDRLVQSGYVQRVEDPNDRRAKLLSLANKGRDFIQRGTQERYHWVNELAEKLTPDERSKITDALNIVIRAAQELETETVH